MRRLPDPVRRALRTFIDAASSTFLLLLTLPQFVDTVGGQPVPKTSSLLSLAVACGWAGVIAVVSFVKNYVEDTSGRALLVPKATPDPEPAGPPGAPGP